MTSRNRVLAALSVQPVDRVPYVELMFHPQLIIELAGGLDNLEKKKCAKLIMEAGTKRSTEYYLAHGELEPDIRRFFSKDNASYWGAYAPFEGGKPYLLDPRTPQLGPSSQGLIRAKKDLSKMVFRKLDKRFWNDAKMFLRRNQGEVATDAVMFLGIDPTWHSMGFENFSTSLLTNPSLVEEVLGRICDWCSEVAYGLSRIGFDFIWAADDIAFKSSTIFSPDIYREVLLPHTKRVAEKIAIPWIYHSDGNLLPVLDELLSQGMSGIHPIEPGAMDPSLLKKRYGHRIALIGNIDVDLLSRGTPEQIRGEVKERISLMGPGYGYMVSSSNTISMGCRPENVRAMVRAVEDFGHYPLVE